MKDLAEQLAEAHAEIARLTPIAEFVEQARQCFSNPAALRVNLYRNLPDYDLITIKDVCEYTDLKNRMEQIRVMIGCPTDGNILDWVKDRVYQLDAARHDNEKQAERIETFDQLREYTEKLCSIIQTLTLAETEREIRGEPSGLPLSNPALIYATKDCIVHINSLSYDSTTTN